MNLDQTMTPAALITVDDNGHIAAWDAVVPSALGWTEDHVLDVQVGELIDAGAARKAFEDWLAAVIRTNPQGLSDPTLHTAFLTRDGAVIDGLVRCEPSCLCPDTRFLYVYLAQIALDTQTAPRWPHRPSSQLH